MTGAPLKAVPPHAQLYCGDALTVLKTLPAESVQCVVTSPPYWGLRDYGVPGQLGLEPTPEEYVAKLVALFGGVRRVLRDDGTLWLNIGDCYNADHKQQKRPNVGLNQHNPRTHENRIAPGLKAKDLVGIPWLVAFRLQADGWWLRSDIIWAKPNPMPESVTDRPTKAHEYVFLLSKSPRYFYDAAAIAEDGITGDMRRPYGSNGAWQLDGRSKQESGNGRLRTNPTPTRNARSIWEIATQPYPEAHFATFPEELARRCIAAGSRPGDVVLDPFGGSGTVAQVATGNGRIAIYIDLNPKYLELARQRIGPLLCGVA